MCLIGVASSNPSSGLILVEIDYEIISIHFTFKTENIEIVDKYKYLGIYSWSSGSYVQAKETLCRTRQQSVVFVLQKIRIHHYH